MTITLNPIGVVRNSRVDLADDGWGNVASIIELDPALSAESLVGLETFPHVEVLFHFDRVTEDSVEYAARHPRGNPAWPSVGIFAQRVKNRPNRLGVTIARIVRREDRCLHVIGLDAVCGTPVLDLKPVMAEFLPREAVRQPSWATELMREYWER